MRITSLPLYSSGPFYDSLTLDYNKNHDPASGRFTGNGGSGTSKKGLTSTGTGGNLQSSQKTIGKNGGTLNAEDMPKVKSSKGIYNIVPDSKITGIYNFAGNGAKPLRVEEHLIRQYGGKKGQWQHTAGNAMIDFGEGPQKTHIHWFQEPTVGIVGVKIKED